MTSLPEPSALLLILVAAWLYGRGVRAVWRQAGPNRGIRRWQVIAFAGGLIELIVAVESPLDELAASLFAAHMVQHLLLILVAAPLLVLGLPLVPFMWGLPEASRRGLARWWRRSGVLRGLWAVVSQPGVAFVLHSLALWAWHVPTLYETAIDNRIVHVFEHLSFLGTGLLFWWTLLHSGRVGYGAGVLYVFGLAIESTALGALLTFASAPWYTSHLATTARWGLTPLEDQQLAGLIMWVPGGAVYLLSGLALLMAWLKSAESGRRPAVAGKPARR
jgi:cytochrome c oxidase assembly factor CtaG